LTAFTLAALALPAGAAEAAADLPGPIDSLDDLQDTAKMLFKLADDNNDNQISQQEALDVANLIVGAYFFRADKNGDSTVTKEEMREARDKILAQRPLLRMLVVRARNNDPQAAQTARNAGQGVLSLLDTNNDGQVQAAEMKQMVQTTVQGFYAAADTNRDGQLSPSEINAAMIGAAKTATQVAFQQADTIATASSARPSTTRRSSSRPTRSSTRSTSTTTASSRSRSSRPPSGSSPARSAGSRFPSRPTRHGTCSSRGSPRPGQPPCRTSTSPARAPHRPPPPSRASRLGDRDGD